MTASPGPQRARKLEGVPRSSKRAPILDTEGVLHILDTAYRAAPSAEAWLVRVAEACAQYLDHGIGVQAYLLDLRQPGRAEYLHPTLIGGTDEWKQVWRRNWWEPFMEPLDHETRLRLHQMAVCIHSTEIWDAAAAGIPTYREFLAHLATTRFGRTHARYAPTGAAPQGDALFYPDSWNVCALEPGGIGCMLLANRAAPVHGPAPARQARIWQRVAAHLTAALRLHDRLLADDRLEKADAIVDARTGRVAHAAGALAQNKELLEIMRAAMLRVDQLHGRSVEGHDALETWRALHEGRWSILDSFDHDGRRYFVAHGNSPTATVAPAPRSDGERGAPLTERERQVLSRVGLGHSNKLIAYELGIACSTVAEHVARIAKKLGLKTRVEMVLEGRQLGAGP